MNVKGLIIVLVILILVGGGGFGFSYYKRNSILNSGRPVLLINEDEGIFTHSNYIQTDDLDLNWKIAGYLDELSMNEINALTEGLQFGGGLQGSIAGLNQAAVELQQPEENEREAWMNAIGALTVQQNQLCENMPTADLSQYCLVRHVVYQAISQNLDISACDGLFVEAHRNECVSHVEAGDISVVADKDSNGLLDSFEFYSDPNRRIENFNEFFGV